MPEKKNTIGRFEIIEKIGEGPIGAVYKALDPVIRRTVAIKVIKLYALEETTTFAEVFEKIYRVVRTSTSLNHPNICIIYDLSEEKKIPYITMEYVDGHDLDSLLMKKHQFKRAELLNILQQTTDALDFAHKKNVIHQDLKSTNILVTPDLHVKITDFGIAGLDEIAAAQTKKLLSIPFYISPEQALGERVSPASDLFSLGVVIYHLLTGQLPFPGTTAANAIMMIARDNPATPSELSKSGISRDDWDSFFGIALAKSPNQRFRSAREMYEAISSILPTSDQTYFPFAFAGPVDDTTGKFEKTYVAEGASPTLLIDTSQLLTEENAPSEPAPETPSPQPITAPVELRPVELKTEPDLAPEFEKTAPRKHEEKPPVEAVPSKSNGQEGPSVPVEMSPFSGGGSIDEEEPFPDSDFMPTLKPTSAAPVTELMQMPRPEPPQPPQPPQPPPPPPPVVEPEKAAEEAPPTQLLRAPIERPAPIQPEPQPQPPELQPEEPLKEEVVEEPPSAATVIQPLPVEAAAPLSPEPRVEPPAPPPVRPSASIRSEPKQFEPPNAPTVIQQMPAQENPLTNVDSTPAEDAQTKIAEHSPAPTPPAPAAPPIQPPVPPSIQRPTAPSPQVPVAPSSQPPAAAKPAPKPVGAPNMKRYLYGALVLGVLILLIGGGILLRKKPSEQEEVQPKPPVETKTQPAQPQPQETVPPVQPASTGTITVTSDPAGATVFVADVEKGITPLEIPDLEFGKYPLKVQLKGYQDVLQDIDLTAQNPMQTFPITLQKAAAVVGTLIVESEPPGAFVVIGNRVLGVTPKTLPNTKAGKYNVTLKKDGYQEFTGSVRVAQNKSVTLKGTLVEIPKPVVKQEPPKPVEPEVRVGQLVQIGPDVTAPKALQKVYPKYPEAAKFKKLEGTVRISVLVDENGDVIDMKIIKSAHPILDEAVLKAYKEWKFQPATKKGVRVKVWTPFSMTFQSSR